jgi:hypothetical protein
MLIDANKLERTLREAKAEAHQAREAANDRGEHRASTYEAGRVAGLAIALEALRLQEAREQFETVKAATA